MNKKVIAAIAVVIIVVAALSIYAYYNSTSTQGKTVLKIYHAGSLSAPLNATAAEFEKEHPNVDVQLEAYGSADAIRQVTDLNRSGDIVAVADYGLIDQRMIPDYTSWNLEFARNELVIVYSNKSKYSNEINDRNWYQILNRSDVKFGFSDPNSDPAGYRSVMMIQLANSYYNDSSIFNSLIASNTGITSKANGTGFVISAPSNINPSSKIMVRPKEVDLMQAVESGNLDYLIIYKSVAEQQKSSGIKYLQLPAELSLKNTTYESEYKKINLIQNSETNQSKSVTLSPIVYGITVLNNAPQKELATEFVQLLISPQGTQIIKDNFQDPISPAIATNDSTNIPDILKKYIKQ
ncbi:MAG TPA: tungstate ABC transporter substrate-binding protein WtpA [Methanobacterium sp.]|nr:tungstate ABC transporter substrate-binding protein WtpA [Methanobacterium sp.]